MHTEYFVFEINYKNILYLSTKRSVFEYFNYMTMLDITEITHRVRMDFTLDDLERSRRSACGDIRQSE